ncbi:NPCBM/NEW2 domain-containing protein [Nonomuraea polychroma]|uniref:NPCBM/NEW2 domain-containing protein n=1 Tax=Nonomuraea polychroma TaxID=46176 RepID=UPI0013E40A04|nr:NPCBM/NEW2 domain-containing protein [Nonomuraea polychroma]
MVVAGCGEPSQSPPATTTTQRAESRYLGEFTVLAGNPAFEIANVNGQPYANSVVVSLFTSPNQIEYDLSRDWQRLKATVGVRDDAPANSRARFEVYGDGNRLYRKDLSFGQAEKIDVDVTRVLRLRMVNTWLTGDSTYSVVWGDAILER